MAKRMTLTGTVSVARDREVTKVFHRGERPNDVELYDVMADLRFHKGGTFQMYDNCGHRFGCRIDALSHEACLAVASNHRVCNIKVLVESDNVAKITTDGNGVTFVYVDKIVEPKPVAIEGAEGGQDVEKA